MNDKPQPARPSWREFRDEMPVTAQWVYLDHAAVAPLPRPSAEVLCQWSNDCQDHGDVHWSRWQQKLQTTRALAADLLSARADEIALIGNTTQGINLVAEGFPWQEGDNVVLLEGEFPSNLYPWLHLQSRGVEARLVAAKDDECRLTLAAQACDARTRIVAVSWVAFASGWRIDPHEWVNMAHQNGALLFLDAIQGLGAFPLNVSETGVDFLAADGHKWMLGPEAAGIFYLRREHLELLQPRGIGWNSVVRPHDFSNMEFQLKPDAGRYEGGSYNTGGHLALGESLAMLQSYGSDAIATRILELTDYAAKQLDERGAVLRTSRENEHRSGIVLFELPGEQPDDVRRRCRRGGVILAARGSGLRISPHAYNTLEEIDRLIEVLFA